jgi:hypothetical protein
LFFNLHLKTRRIKMFKTLVVMFMVMLTTVGIGYADQTRQMKLEQGGMTQQEVKGAVVGGATGGAVGVGGSVAAISKMGTIAGLSGTGITSGLKAIGVAAGLKSIPIAGGAMLGGIVVCTGGTVLLVGAVGYGGYRAVRWWYNDD